MMTDLSPIVRTALQSQASASQLGAKGYSYDLINDFLKEAYQINSRAQELLQYLRSIRQPYLSTVPAPRRRRLDASQQQSDTVYLSDAQRDQIDAEAKSVLRDLNAAVGNLSQAEQVRQETESVIAQKRRRKHGAFGALGQWAAGGGSGGLGGGQVEKSAAEELEEARANGVKVHREGVIWFLQRHLERCGLAQTSMMEIRLKRATERSESMLYESHTRTGSAGPVPVWDSNANNAVSGLGGHGEYDSYDQPVAEDVDEEQMQLFAKENQDMLKQYERKIDQVRTAERSLVEIAELQSTLATNLEMQSVHIDQLVQDSFATTENVGTGNKELKKASERKSTARMVFYGTVGLCSTLIVWDLIF